MKLTPVFLTGVLFSFLLVSGPALTAENYLGNPTTPYPPGCATNYQIADQFPGKEADINAGTVMMGETLDPSSMHEVKVRIWRRGCAEPDRSILMFEMTVTDDGDGIVQSVPSPIFRADYFGSKHLLRGVSEPNSWYASEDAKRVEEGNSLTLYLDGISVYDPTYDESLVLTADEYNGDFNLEVLDSRNMSGFVVDIPEYRNQHLASELALNGRLSGTWAVPGIPDQGFLLAFEELIKPSSPHVFLSWYTFDQNGNTLWLTGNSRFDIGDTQVEIPIVLVQNGEFMGNRTADRTAAGTVILKANSCNDLMLTFDLQDIGLGQGAHGLRRLFSLETQGYACRDDQARLDALD